MAPAEYTTRRSDEQELLVLIAFGMGRMYGAGDLALLYFTCVVRHVWRGGGMYSTQKGSAGWLHIQGWGA
jgi:hypothetical protein